MHYMSLPLSAKRPNAKKPTMVLPVDQAKVEALAQSIQEVGLQEPVSVVSGGKAYLLHGC